MDGVRSLRSEPFAFATVVLMVASSLVACVPVADASGTQTFTASFSLWDHDVVYFDDGPTDDLTLYSFFPGEPHNSLFTTLSHGWDFLSDRGKLVASGYELALFALDSNKEELDADVLDMGYSDGCIRVEFACSAEPSFIVLGEGSIDHLLGGYGMMKMLSGHIVRTTLSYGVPMRYFTDSHEWDYFSEGEFGGMIADLMNGYAELRVDEYSHTPYITGQYLSGDVFLHVVDSNGMVPDSGLVAIVRGDGIHVAFEHSGPEIYLLGSYHESNIDEPLFMKDLSDGVQTYATTLSMSDPSVVLNGFSPDQLGSIDPEISHGCHLFFEQMLNALDGPMGEHGLLPPFDHIHVLDANNTIIDVADMRLCRIDDSIGIGFTSSIQPHRIIVSQGDLDLQQCWITWTIPESDDAPVFTATFVFDDPWFEDFSISGSEIVLPRSDYSATPGETTVAWVVSEGFFGCPGETVRLFSDVTLRPYCETPLVLETDLRNDTLFVPPVNANGEPQYAEFTVTPSWFVDEFSFDDGWEYWMDDWDYGDGSSRLFSVATHRFDPMGPHEITVTAKSPLSASGPADGYKLASKTITVFNGVYELRFTSSPSTGMILVA